MLLFLADKIFLYYTQSIYKVCVALYTIVLCTKCIHFVLYTKSVLWIFFSEVKILYIIRFQMRTSLIAYQISESLQ